MKIIHRIYKYSLSVAAASLVVASLFFASGLTGCGESVDPNMSNNVSGSASASSVSLPEHITDSECTPTSDRTADSIMESSISESDSIEQDGALLSDDPGTDSSSAGIFESSANSESGISSVPQGTSIDDLEPGTILSEADNPASDASIFKIYEIEEGGDIWQQIYEKSYPEGCSVPLSDLRYLKMLHYNFDHKIQVGEMIVNREIAEDVISIFEELFENEYEIEQMFLVDRYWTGDAEDTDENSIEHNNSSAFNYREITGGGKLSNHALGKAIDINPQQNPYIYLSGGSYVWDHDNAAPYIDRSSGDPHMIVSGDLCQSTFEKYGFSWGGFWHNPIDYQHFEKP